MIMGYFVGPMFLLEGRMATVSRPKSQSIAHSYSLNHCKYHNLKEALQILQIADDWVDSSTYVSLLQGCIRKKSLPYGKLVHAHFNQAGFTAGILLDNTLINMYFKCGSLVDARRVFDQMAERNVCSWTLMIAGYAKHGFPEEALVLFHRMQRAGIQPNQFTFASVLPAYATLGSLEEAVRIHEEIIRNGFVSDVFVANALVGMYAKCGRIETARDMFDKIPEPNMVSWTTMIVGYVQTGCLNEALQLFRNMPERNLFTCTAMITGYAQNGFVDEAFKLFKEIPQPDVVSWNVMIAGFVQSGHGREALEIFQHMQLSGAEPNPKTFSSILSACANLASLEQERPRDIQENASTRRRFLDNSDCRMHAEWIG